MISFFQSLPISATQCLCLLLLTCLLALAASFPDVDIRNLYLLNGTMDDIMNAPPQSSQPGKYGPATGRGKPGPDQSDPTQPTPSSACPHPCHTKEGLNTALRMSYWNKSNLRVPLCLLPVSSPAWHEVLLSVSDRRTAKELFRAHRIPGERTIWSHWQQDKAQGVVGRGLFLEKKG